MPLPDRSGGAEHVDVQVNPGDFDVPEALIERAVRHAIQSHGAAGGTRGEVSVTFLSDEAIQALNGEYLSEDRPTDVIAFSLGGPERTLGDVYIGYDQAERQSAELGVVLREELVRLAIHGTLHLLGHDHPAGVERAESPMFTLQERLVRELLDGAGA